ncbi:MAG: dockerin type I domain-containing protein, partial [Planctomycetota bacterium]
GQDAQIDIIEDPNTPGNSVVKLVSSSESSELAQFVSTPFENFQIQFDALSLGQSARLEVFIGNQTVAQFNADDLASDKFSQLSVPIFDATLQGNTDVALKLVWSSESGTQEVLLDNLQIGSGLILGDVNGDGVVDLLDVQPFVQVLTDQGYLPAADVNQDGTVNLLDVAPFVGLLTGS